MLHFGNLDVGEGTGCIRRLVKRAVDPLAAFAEHLWYAQSAESQRHEGRTHSTHATLGACICAACVSRASQCMWCTSMPVPT